MLEALDSGQPGAAEELLPLVYDELHRIAGRLMRREGEHTLQPTALIHEAYLRLAGDRSPRIEDRTDFVRLAARAMRNVLVDHARRKRSAKRGGDRLQVALDDELLETNADGERLLLLDDALRKLANLDPQLAAIVELRFFGGLGHRETARALDTSVRSVERGWRTARAWLAATMGEP